MTGIVDIAGVEAANPANGPTGTVTSVSVTTANGVSGTVATATTTPAISLTLGAITPSSVAIGAGSAITSSGAGGALGTGAFSTAFSGSAAGGALAGTYPNPTLAPTVATTAHGIVVQANSNTPASVTAASTSEQILATIVVPAVPAGAILRLSGVFSFTGVTGTKTTRVYYGATGSGVGGALYASTTNAGATLSQNLSNATVRNITTGTQIGAIGGANAVTTSSVTTTVATEINITGQLSSALDTFTLQGYTLEILLP